MFAAVEFATAIDTHIQRRRSTLRTPTDRYQNRRESGVRPILPALLSLI